MIRPMDEEERNRAKERSMLNNRWTVTVEEDPETGDLILPLNPDILAQVGWDFGDELLWEDMHDGTWSLRKKDANK